LFELTFLGTSAAAPSARRGLSSQIVSYRNHRFLIDCGEGTQRQILQSGIGFRRLSRILITHGHLDHILGLAGLLSTFMRWEAIDRLEIWGGRWALERIRDLLFGVVLRGARPPIEIDLIPIEKGVIFEDAGFQITAFPVEHRGRDSFGFRFDEPPRRPFLPDRADALGIPFGPRRRELVEGKTITLPDGKNITPDDVLGPERRGTRLVHVGDCGRVDDLVEYCQQADAIVIEATYLDFEVELAREFGHLTARQAAQLAVSANARQLYLTHISRRYRERQVLEEASTIFPNTAVARDFDRYEIRRDP
jgi:ribonuclease Z